MTVRRLMVTVCALTILACDSKKLTEATVDEPTPSFTPTKLRTLLNPTVRRLEGATTAMVTAGAQHDPRTQFGSKVQCFDGTNDGDQGGVTYGGVCRRTRGLTHDLAELHTSDGDPHGSYAGVYAVPVNIRGKRLGDVQELRFSYAGGATSSGSPRWSVAIDENANARHDGEEAYAFADVNGCNDGNTSVGTLDGEDDGSCSWSYKSETFANWDAFAGAHPSYRIARLHADGSTGFIPAFVITDQPGDWIVWNVAVE
jgi:hypothetical protein